MDYHLACLSLIPQSNSVFIVNQAVELRIKHEEDARNLAEEQERLRIEEEERQLLEEVEKRQQELDRLRSEQLERAERQIMHEFDHSLAQIEDSEEDDENASKKSDETHYFEGFLHMKTGGMVNSWKKRWCVLRDETLMWFKSKQEALKSGWLMKKGGGTGTLSRRNWRKRFFILKDFTLSYYESDSNTAKLLGKIDIKGATNITDSSFGRENSIDIETDGRTYHLVADTADDCSEWYSILTRVKNSQDFELKQMHDEEANPKNAIGSLDVAIIDSVVPVNIAAKPNCFAIITAERVINLMSDTPVGMNNWLAALTQYHKGKRAYKQEDIILSGWLTKESTSTGTLARVSTGTRKKRYFVLTANSLEFYRSVELQQKMGAIAFNSLCSVTLPDEKTFKEEGYWKFVVHGRNCSFNLYTVSYDDAWQWTYAIQDVIDSKPLLETPFQILIREIKVTTSTFIVGSGLVNQDHSVHVSGNKGDHLNIHC